MFKCYRTITWLAAGLIPLWLGIRRLKGKEDPARLRERYGHASLPRPKGMLLWLHAASVGEANSVLPLIDAWRTRFPQLSILMTTGTVTSARLMAARLPKKVLHQFAPVDTPQATERFMRHWMPDMALWVESELWPNLVEAADRHQCFMSVINGRMSERSFAFWKKHPDMIHGMLSCFDAIFAQSPEDAERFKALSAKNVSCVGNIKYDADMLPCNESELIHLRNAIGHRPVWLAASTHPGEETLIAETHRIMASHCSNLLTIIVPRHPDRGREIATELSKKHRAALRSRQDAIFVETEFYIADTLGELGLFYRLCPVAFMGGSLVRHGGQNPLEPARLSCAIITGPHTHNFSAIYQEMVTAGACQRVKNAAELALQTAALLGDSKAAAAQQAQAASWLESKSGATHALIARLAPLLSQGSSV